MMAPTAVWVRRLLALIVRPEPQARRSSIDGLAAAQLRRANATRRIDGLERLVDDYRAADERLVRR